MKRITKWRAAARRELIEPKDDKRYIRRDAKGRIPESDDVGFERHNLSAEPRSIYLLRGPSRTEWQHSIPGVESLRYSITFRNLLEGDVS